jgi:hypothetical protein
MTLATSTRRRSCPRLLVGLLAAFAALTSAEAASADPGASSEEPGPPRPEPPPATRAWYGWQTLLSDSATIAVTALAATQPSTQGAAPITFFAGYVVAPAVVHAAHGNPGGATTSVLVRLLVPCATGAVGLGVGLATMGNGEWSGLWPVVTTLGGAAGGMVTASLIDAFALARESPAPRDAAPSATSRGVHLAPTLGLGPHDASAGVTGTF